MINDVVRNDEEGEGLKKGVSAREGMNRRRKVCADMVTRRYETERRRKRRGKREKRELRELSKKTFVGHVVNDTYYIGCRVIRAKCL